MAWPLLGAGVKGWFENITVPQLSFLKRVTRIRDPLWPSMRTQVGHLPTVREVPIRDIMTNGQDFPQPLSVTRILAVVRVGECGEFALVTPDLFPGSLG